MAARERVLCIGNHLKRTAEELRDDGFDVVLLPDAQAARVLIHIHPPDAVLGHPEQIREIHRKHPTIPAVLVLGELGGKIPPHSATRKVNQVLGKKD